MAGLSLHFIVLLYILASNVQAHTHIRNLIIDGTALDRGKCIRPYKSNFNFPEKGVENEDIICRTTSMSSSSTDICDVKAGSSITMEFHEEESRSSRAIEGKHYGPCLVYMAPLESNGKGNVWFKIFEQGYDPDKKEWCIDTLNAAKGKLDIVIPADIADGQYLLRGEIIALHLAEKVGGAEFYPNCAQIKVVGGGTSHPTGVAIPQIYKEDDPGIHFNLYDGYDSYSIPGPKLYKPGNTPPADNGSSVDEHTTSDIEEDTSSNDDNQGTSIPDESHKTKERPSRPCKRKRGKSRRRLRRSRRSRKSLEL